MGQTVTPVPARLALLVLAALLAPGCLGPAGTVPGAGDGATAEEAPALVEVPGVLIETDHGDITLLLYPDRAPRTVANFVRLVKAGFYDGLLFHRIVDGFVIQGGDPTGTGAGGSLEKVPLETHPDLFFSAGAVGMARMPHPDTADSQFFITETPQPHLHAPQGAVSEAYGEFTVFAQVRRAEYAPEGTPDGMGVVRVIAGLPTVPGADRPLEDVPMRRVSLVTLTLPLSELLHYPLRTTARASDGDYQYVLETPRTLQAGAAPVSVQWYVRAQREGLAPPAEARMLVRGPSGELAVPLAAHPEDPWVLRSPLAFSAAGDHEVVFLRGTQETARFTVTVAPAQS